jgi:two-component system chemotaxis response regulator CheY
MALNILLVDDSSIVRAVLTKTLHLAGVQVKELYTATNGQEALDILKDHWVDLVMTDINMPVMSGIELVDKMHASDLMKSIPVIIVSTDGSAARIEELRAKGVRAFVRKPFTPELIRQIVSETVGEN